MARNAQTTVAVAAPRISFWGNWWIIIVIAALIASIRIPVNWYLNFIHIFSSLMWTGTDLFMGFIMGPILRNIDFPARRAVYQRLIPRMLFFMPTLAATSITSGYYLAKRFGLFDLPYPQFYWVLAALIVSGVLTLQGMGLLLPTNLRVFFEMRKEQPDGEKIQRLMRFYIKVVASQAIMQIAIVTVMTRFRTGV